MWAPWIVGLWFIFIDLFLWPWIAHLDWWLCYHIPGYDTPPFLIGAFGEIFGSNRLESPEFQALDDQSGIYSYDQLLQTAIILYIIQNYQPDSTTP
jgi:hypothetical protein